MYVHTYFSQKKVKTKNTLNNDHMSVKIIILHWLIRCDDPHSDQIESICIRIFFIRTFAND